MSIEKIFLGFGFLIIGLIILSLSKFIGRNFYPDTPSFFEIIRGKNKEEIRRKRIHFRTLLIKIIGIIFTIEGITLAIIYYFY